MADRQTTVLFADISGSTQLYETAGDRAALEAIARCLAAFRRSAEAAGGRVVKTIGDEILALFPTPDAAAAAAADMQAAIDAMLPVGGAKLGARIGFHTGPVIQKDDDVFGDTVNLASRLVEQAVKGQIITSTDTAAQLGPVYRMLTRSLYAIQVKGKADEVGLTELVWRPDADSTVFASTHPPARASAAPLRLLYKGREVVRRRENDSILFGREQGCGLEVAGVKASRQHCTIERRQDKWVLKDHSTNGTYVTLEGDTEVHLRREELILRRHGWIACGQSRGAAGEDLIEFFCD